MNSPQKLIETKIKNTIDTFEPINDPDRNELPDGTTVTYEASHDNDNNEISIKVSNSKKLSLVQKFYESLRTAPLRKVLAILTYFTDVCIVCIGIFLQHDLPPEIAAGWNISRMIIYGGYFGSSTTEAVAGMMKKRSQQIPQNNQQKIKNDNNPQIIEEPILDEE